MIRIFLLVFLLILSTVAVVPAQTSRRAFEKGTRAANRGDFARALNYFQTALDAGDSAGSDLEAKIHYNLGVCLFHLNQTTQAIAEYEKAIAAQSGNYQKAFYALGAAHAKRRNWRGAKTAFEAAIRLGSVEAWFDLGLISVEEKDFAAAAIAFAKAIETKSVASSAAHNNLGVIAAANNDFQAAEKEFETALKQSNNNFAEAENNLAHCRARLRNQNLTAKLKFYRK